MKTFPLSVRLLLINQLGVNTGFYMLIPYLATHLTDNLGMSVAVVAIVLGVRNLSQQGLFLIGGVAADRLGARRVIIAGCGLRTIGFGLFAVGESLPLLLAAAVLSGVAGALFNPAVRAYIAVEATEDRRAEAFALFNVFAQTGALLGPVLGSVLLLVNFRVSAIVSAGIFAALTIAQALVLPARKTPPAEKSAAAGIRECLTNRRFLAFTGALAGMFALQNQLYLVLPVEAERVTGSASSVAALFLVSTVATLVFQVRITRRFTRIPRGRAIALGMAIMGAGFIAPALSHLWAPSNAIIALLPVLTATLFLAFGLMIAQPFVYELIPAFGSEAVAGTYFGVFYLGSGALAALSTVVIGWVGGIGWLASLLCAALGFGSAAAVALRERRGVLTPGKPEAALA
ncbi:MFS transporter [Actinokineospora iranica]|uniref:Predicted arabinose efflux permease, MFS family n=1 Tax=Actinokineospora iranica TaxID=1271860 RepID=A0A1G6S2R0_9PSEU|nr:MFS transporter [Actinokineospora iranica]SDD10954.1 Predicted arabinose efflux permease, MFS family [Actinokineospora iranica]